MIAERDGWSHANSGCMMNRATDMEKSDFTIERDMIWMKFADLLVDTGVITDTLENRTFQKRPEDHNRVQQW
jgi:hypothetical protein